MEWEGDELSGPGEVATVERWLDTILMESLRISDEAGMEERARALDAARTAIRELAPKGTGIEERMQALAYVCSLAAGLDYQAGANSCYFSPETRERAQRQARETLTLANRQLTLLLRLRAERAKADEEAARRARIAEMDRRWIARQRSLSPPALEQRGPVIEANPADDRQPAPLTPDERRCVLERLHTLAGDGA